MNDLPSVYIETSFISYLTARDSSNLFVLTKQRASRRWWARSRVNFRVFVSDAVVREALRGNATAAQKRKDVLHSLVLLETTPSAVDLAALLVERQAIPAVAAEDALHVAVAAVHEMNYLLTWNFRHINNAIRKQHLAEVCQSSGFRVPVICTPDELREESRDE